MSNNNGWLKDGLDKIDNKMEKMDQRIDNIDITLAKQAIILEEHIRRSAANEQHVELLKEKIDLEIKPLQEKLMMMNGVVRLVSISASVIGLIAAVSKWLF